MNRLIAVLIVLNCKLNLADELPFATSQEPNVFDMLSVPTDEWYNRNAAEFNSTGSKKGYLATVGNTSPSGGSGGLISPSRGVKRGGVKNHDPSSQSGPKTTSEYTNLRGRVRPSNHFKKVLRQPLDEELKREVTNRRTIATGTKIDNANSPPAKPNDNQTGKEAG